MDEKYVAPAMVKSSILSFTVWQMLQNGLSYYIKCEVQQVTNWGTEKQLKL